MELYAAVIICRGKCSTRSGEPYRPSRKSIKYFPRELPRAAGRIAEAFTVAELMPEAVPVTKATRSSKGYSIVGFA